MGMSPRERSDLIVVGAGAAGLYAALTAARVGARVTLISAAPLAESSSYWAQGGLAAALGLRYYWLLGESEDPAMPAPGMVVDVQAVLELARAAIRDEAALRAGGA